MTTQQEIINRWHDLSYGDAANAVDVDPLNLDCEAMETTDALWALFERDPSNDVFQLPWLVALPDGSSLQFSEEETAYLFQRRWREELGLNPLTGRVT